MFCKVKKEPDGSGLSCFGLSPGRGRSHPVLILAGCSRASKHCNQEGTCPCQLTIFNPHPRICVLGFFFCFLWFQRGPEREKHLLPPLGVRTGNQVCSLSVFRTTLQPAEPPSQDSHCTQTQGPHKGRRVQPQNVLEIMYFTETGPSFVESK